MPFYWRWQNIFQKSFCSNIVPRHARFVNSASEICLLAISKENLDKTPNPATDDSSNKTLGNGGLNLNSPDKKENKPGYGGIA